MNTTLKNNLTALASRDPAAAHAVKTASLKSNRLVMEQSRSGTDWTGYYQSNSGKKAYLASRYQPSREASKRVEHLDYQNKYLFVIIGFGLGYELREIMNRMHEQAVVIVIEPRPDLMRAALESIPLEDVISGRNLFWALGNKADIQAALQCHSLTLAQFLNSVEVFEHPVLKRHLEESYAGLLKMFFDAATYNIIAVGNDPQDTMLGIENAFNNFDAILSSPDISRYFATLTDRPAIVIMAGPSLDEQMPVLKTIDRDRALLLCADTILNKLLQEGIIPHLVFTLERGEVVYELFYKNTVIPGQLCLVAQPVVDPQILSLFPGRTFMLFRSATTFEKWMAESLGHIPSLECGLSVAHMVFSTARALGCTPLVLIGQDLCYSEEGLSYSAGTHRSSYTVEDDNKEGLGLTEASGRLEVPAIGGGTVKTRHDWWLFLQWLEVEVGKTGVPVIDVKNHGAKIRGAIQMPLQEVVDTYCRKNLPVPFAPVVPETAPEQNRLEKRLRSIGQALLKEIEKTRAAVALFEKAQVSITDLGTLFMTVRGSGVWPDDFWDNKSAEITGTLLSAYETIKPVGLDPCLVRFIIQPVLFQYALQSTPYIDIGNADSALAWQRKQATLLSQLVELSRMVEEHLTKYLEVVRTAR